jgi:Cof subfamily protein (haloacid dehalogenase superfamily)
MSKTLYAADLDGTLLAPGAVLSDFSKTVLSELLEKGLNFTVATARTPATVTRILDGLNIHLPLIMMNGAVSFSIAKRRFCDVTYFPPDINGEIIKIANLNPVTTFLYTYSKNSLKVFYRDDGQALTREFISFRSGSAYKTFIRVSDYREAECSNIIYTAALGPGSVCSEFLCVYKKITSLDTIMYREVNLNGIYVLESYTAGVSKAKAIKKLANDIGADKIVAFGDNINDMEMLIEADTGLAVGNAVPELIARADAVIGKNTEDGVVKWLLENV